MATSNTTLSSGQRKYTEIWQAVKRYPYFVKIKCLQIDVYTIIQGVKKEKTRDKSKDKTKILTTQVTADGIEFRLREDTSIRNL